MQKKLLVTLIASAFAGVAGVAHAGPISVGSVNTYSAEVLPNATPPLQVANVAYQLTNPIANAATGTFTYALDAGVSAASPAVTANCPTLGAITNLNGGLATAATSISSDGKTCNYAFSTTAAIPSNTILSFSNGKTDGLSTLASAGKVVATVGVLDSTGASVAGEGNSTTVALAANSFNLVAVTSGATSSPAFKTNIELSKLNVAATPPLSAFTADTTGDVTSGNTTTINVGAVVLTENNANFLDTDASTKVNLTTVTGEKVVVTVGGPLVASATVGLRANADCTGAVAGAGADVVAAAGDTSAKITINPPTTTSGSAYTVYACYIAPGGTKTMNPGQFTLAATYDATSPFSAVALTQKATGTKNVYNLTLNGVRIDIRNHIPTTVTGWTNAYRIINTGSVAASFSAQYIGVDGVVGTAGVIATNVPAGGTVVVSVPQVEAVIGAAPAAPAGVGPRLRITAPTDSARVQVYGVQPNGSIFTNTDAQGADDGGADQ